MLTILSIVNSKVYGQVNRYDQPADQPVHSTYVPSNNNQVYDALRAKQAEYDKNEAKLMSLMNWILDTKSQVSESQFLNELNNYYNQLSNLMDTDLSLAGKDLNRIQLKLNEAVYNYNSRLKANSNK
jgi:hypothetical protein